MNILMVVAHPDDEVLGSGGTIYTLSGKGHRIAVCTMANHAAARANLSDTLLDDQKRAHAILGVSETYAADFPNIQMNTVPHLTLVQFIEKCITDFGADFIITHHPADTNNDHVMTSYAAQAAAHIYQRRQGVPRLNELWYMEVPSSTEWSFDTSSDKFNPNCFVEIGDEGVAAKVKALAEYKGVTREYPHPCSDEAIKGLAAYRGAQSGNVYAEAFEIAFRSLRSE